MAEVKTNTFVLKEISHKTKNVKSLTSAPLISNFYLFVEQTNLSRNASGTVTSRATLMRAPQKYCQSALSTHRCYTPMSS